MFKTTPNTQRNVILTVTVLVLRFENVIQMCAVVLYPQHGICIDFGARELQIRVYCPEIIYKPYGHAVQCTFLQQVDELDFVDF